MAQYIRKETYTMKEKEWNITEDVQDNNFSVFVNDILTKKHQFALMVEPVQENQH